jgi:hypothetical protein
MRSLHKLRFSCSSCGSREVEVFLIDDQADVDGWMSAQPGDPSF